MNTITLTKKNGNGYASKNAATNAFNAFMKLNTRIIRDSQLWMRKIEEVETGYVITISPETGEIFTPDVALEDRAIYRTKTEKNKFIAMISERPSDKTENEIQLEKELKELKETTKEVTKKPVKETNLSGTDEMASIKQELLKANAALEMLKNRIGEKTIFETSENTDHYVSDLVDVFGEESTYSELEKNAFRTHLGEFYVSTLNVTSLEDITNIRMESLVFELNNSNEENNKAHDIEFFNPTEEELELRDYYITTSSDVIADDLIKEFAAFGGNHEELRPYIIENINEFKADDNNIDLIRTLEVNRKNILKGLKG